MEVKYSIFLLVALATTALALPAAKKVTRGEVIDERGVYSVGWESDGVTITFSVVANTTGYVGLGFSPTGSMGGADIFIGGVFENGTSYAGDYFAFGHETPTLDAVQDYELLSAQENSTHTSYVVRRNVADVEDYPPDFAIPSGFAWVLWAYGETDDIVFHGFESKGKFNVTLVDV